MSNSAWARAAPLYKMEIPNDPRLGWAPPRLDIVDFMINAACVGLYTVVIGVRSPPVYLVVVGAIACIAVGVMLFRHRRAHRKSVACTPLSETNLRRYVVEMQGAVILGTADDGAKEQLGRELGLFWAIPSFYCIALTLMVWSNTLGTPYLIFFNLVPLVVLSVAKRAAGRWIDKFKTRIYKRECVGCGYVYGGPVEPVRLCPECGVILPILIRTPLSPAEYIGGIPPHAT